MLTHTFENEEEFWNVVYERHPDFEVICEQIEPADNYEGLQSSIIVKRISDGVYFALPPIYNHESLTANEVRLKRKLVEYWG